METIQNQSQKASQGVLYVTDDVYKSLYVCNKAKCIYNLEFLKIAVEYLKWFMLL